MQLSMHNCSLEAYAQLSTHNCSVEGMQLLINNCTVEVYAPSFSIASLFIQSFQNIGCSFNPSDFKVFQSVNLFMTKPVDSNHLN